MSTETTEPDDYLTVTPFGVVHALFDETPGVRLEGPPDAVEQVRRAIERATNGWGMTMTVDTVEPADYFNFCQPEGSGIMILEPAEVFTAPPVRVPGDDQPVLDAVTLPPEEEAKCHEAYENYYHKVRADISYDDWRRVWRQALKSKALLDAAEPPKKPEGDETPAKQGGEDPPPAPPKDGDEPAGDAPPADDAGEGEKAPKDDGEAPAKDADKADEPKKADEPPAKKEGEEEPEKPAKGEGDEPKLDDVRGDLRQQFAGAQGALAKLAIARQINEASRSFRELSPDEQRARLAAEKASVTDEQVDAFLSTWGQASADYMATGFRVAGIVPGIGYVQLVKGDVPQLTTPEGDSSVDLTPEQIADLRDAIRSGFIDVKVFRRWGNGADARTPLRDLYVGRGSFKPFDYKFVMVSRTGGGQQAIPVSRETIELLAEQVGATVDVQASTPGGAVEFAAIKVGPITGALEWATGSSQYRLTCFLTDTEAFDQRGDEPGPLIRAFAEWAKARIPAPPAENGPVTVEEADLPELAAKIAEAMKAHGDAYAAQSRDDFEAFKGAVQLTLRGAASGREYVVGDLERLARVVAELLQSGEGRPDPGPGTNTDPAVKEREAALALLEQIATGTHPDMLAPETADLIEQALARFPDDPNVAAAAERAAIAYSNGLIAAT